MEEGRLREPTQGHEPLSRTGGDQCQRPKLRFCLGITRQLPTFETEGPKLELGAIFHIPVRQEGGKTFYKALACKVEITAEQRAEIVKMLGGEVLPVTTEPKG